MNILLFGGKNKGTAVLNKLLEMKYGVVGLVYFDTDRHERIWYEKPEHAASGNNIPTIYYKDIYENIKALRNFDLIIVAGWRYKIPKDIYSIPPKGCVVLHDSLLPKYRGFAPMNWALINGETETGVTLFHIVEEIDAGDIIGQKSVEIKLDDYALSLDNKLTNLYGELIEEYIPLIESGDAPRTKQLHSEATYCCKRIPSDGRIDWSKSSLEIYNKIRGLSYPYPCAFSYVSPKRLGEKIHILNSEIDSDNAIYVGSVPGRVFEIIKGKGVKVLTGNGSLVINTVLYMGDMVSADQVIKSVKDTLV